MPAQYQSNFGYEFWIKDYCKFNHFYNTSFMHYTSTNKRLTVKSTTSVLRVCVRSQLFRKPKDPRCIIYTSCIYLFQLFYCSVIMNVGVYTDTWPIHDWQQVCRKWAQFKILLTTSLTEVDAIQNSNFLFRFIDAILQDMQI